MLIENTWLSDIKCKTRCQIFQFFLNENKDDQEKNLIKNPTISLKEHYFLFLYKILFQFVLKKKKKNIPTISIFISKILLYSYFTPHII